MHIVLLGPPGSGKGTLAADLVQLYDLEHVSTGDIFRWNIKEETPLGRDASRYIKSGKLVPDDVTIAMVADRLDQPQTGTGFLFDGFPRTVDQAKALDVMLEKRAAPLAAVLNLVVSEETIIRRLSNRRLCSICGRSYNLVSIPPQVKNICDDCGGTLVQRDDDKPETIRVRLETYRNQTKPLIDFYQSAGILVDIDNEGSIEACTIRARAEIDKLAASR